MRTGLGPGVVYGSGDDSDSLRQNASKYTFADADTPFGGWDRSVRRLGAESTASTRPLEGQGASQSSDRIMSVLTFPAAFRAWQTPASALPTHTCFLTPEARGWVGSPPLYHQEGLQHP